MAKEKWEKDVDARIFGERTESEEFNKKIIKPWQELRPKETEFTGVYSAEEIKRDLDLVKKIKNSQDYVDAKTEAAIVAEYGLPYLIEDEQILGAASVSLASEFDDLKRGVDLVLRYSAEGNDYYVAIDFKTNAGGREDDYRVRESVNKSIDDVRSNRLREIKYFVGSQDNSKKRIEAPRIVVVFDSEEMLQLRDILPIPLNKRTHVQKEKIEKIKESLIYKMQNFCKSMIEATEQLMTRSSEPQKENIVRLCKRFLNFIEQQ
ncbi:MAG: hypothetical protein V1928_02655 [Parcubacteria group bacterium]